MNDANIFHVGNSTDRENEEEKIYNLVRDLYTRIDRVSNMVDEMAAQNRLLQAQLDAANLGYIKIAKILAEKNDAQ
jgi:hypothetical protein